MNIFNCIIASILLLSSCNSNESKYQLKAESEKILVPKKNKQIIHNEDIINLTFSPSFSWASNFTFEMNQNKAGLKVKIFKPAEPWEDGEKITILDSVFFSIKEEYYYKIKNIFKIESIKNYKQKSSRGIDGLTVSVRKVDIYGDTIFIHFWSPSRADSSKIPEYLIIDTFFYLAENIAIEHNNIKYLEYIEDLKSYFDFGLPIKKINQKPLEYRFWGSITSTEEILLNEFIEKLPDDEYVIFDFTNFGGMGTMYYPVFQELNKKKKIHYLTKEYERDDLKAIGNCNIYKSREKLMKKLEKK